MVMDWTEAEARLVTLEREVTRHQRLARDNGRMAAVADGPAVARGPRRGRWLGHWLWRRLPAAAGAAGAVGALRAIAARVA
jgi:hypothetical protein